jgi:topoisomerase IA-like protein
MATTRTTHPKPCVALARVLGKGWQLRASAQAGHTLLYHGTTLVAYLVARGDNAVTVRNRKLGVNVPAAAPKAAAVAAKRALVLHKRRAASTAKQRAQAQPGGRRQPAAKPAAKRTAAAKPAAKRTVKVVKAVAQPAPQPAAWQPQPSAAHPNLRP